jgi:hypothetical protein
MELALQRREHLSTGGLEKGTDVIEELTFAGKYLSFRA